MSAICGLVRPAGELVSDCELAVMHAALAGHGKDGGGLWRDGRAGLGQQLRCVTPEDRWERSPMVSTDGLRVLVSDARIDNRRELAVALDLRDATETPDSAFILRAYEIWGEQCACHLVGAFAFALWDTHEQRLLIARSPMAERPLYYHASRERFVFATAPAALFTVPGVPRALDEQYLADYLALERAEPGTTFYRDVRRLMPGHTMIVGAGGSGSRSRAHWRLDEQVELRLPRDDDYVEAFDALFTRVVRDHLRSERPVGIMLSGGLDSSSVAAVAAPLLAERHAVLHAFTEVPRRGFAGPVMPGRYTDETPFVRALSAVYGNLAVNYIDSTGQFFLDSVEELFAAAGAPFRNASNRMWYEAILREARGLGVGVILSGAQGNLTVSWSGRGLLAQLCRRRHWRRAFREGRAATTSRRAAVRKLLAEGVLPLLPTPLHLAVRRARCANSGVDLRPWRGFAPINPQFAARHRVDERARQRGPDFRLHVGPDVRLLRSQMLARMAEFGEGLDAGYAALFDVETRDPTGDSRVVEFCLSLPEDQYLRDGQDRWLLRRAMQRRLPAAILENRRRGLQAADWFERMQQRQSEIASELVALESSNLARRAINLPYLRQLVEKMPDRDPSAPSVQDDYRGRLGLGLMTGRFIRWVEAS